MAGRNPGTSSLTGIEGIVARLGAVFGEAAGGADWGQPAGVTGQASVSQNLHSTARYFFGDCFCGGDWIRSGDGVGWLFLLRDRSTEALAAVGCPRIARLWQHDGDAAPKKFWILYCSANRICAFIWPNHAF
jgi:hypothetical protein